jgi:galactose-1-phosphate uridylyltransferase
MGVAAVLPSTVTERVANSLISCTEQLPYLQRMPASLQMQGGPALTHTHYEAAHHNGYAVVVILAVP